MCGICGKISLNSNRPVDSDLIGRMARALSHRGPEDEGFYFFQTEERPFVSVALGHRRLKIIDLSERAHQPLSDETGKIWVVFNGEIYNYRELRAELLQKGHPFRSSSDTEVLVHLYKEEGIDCVKRLDGMFAFALWDETKKLLLLARDPVGKKPLFYTENSQGVAFASELKALLKDLDFRKEIDDEAIDEYLSLHYIPGPRTIFQGVKKLLPGHILVYQSGKTDVVPYWAVTKSEEDVKEGKAAEKLIALLEEATRKRLVSDVPLGVFLSGGIDSSAIVAMMRRISPRGTIRTFSIGFEESRYDERPFAKRVAGLFKTDHHEFLMKPDLLEVLPKIVWSLDEPFADSSVLPTFYLAKDTRREVTVALNGDGGDELFGGYERYAANVLSAWLQKNHLALPFRAFASFAELFSNGEADRIDASIRLKRFSGALSSLPAERYLNWVGLFSQEEREELYTPAFREKVSLKGAPQFLADCYGRFSGIPFSAATPLVDLVSYLPNDLLVKADRMTMAHALEGRSPFLDKALVTFAATLPFSMKVRGVTTKYLLKRSLAPFLPKDILNRKKQGFGVPVGRWFRGELREMVQELLLGERFLERGLFRRQALERLIERHLSGKEDLGARLWGLVTLELWHRLFIDGETVDDLTEKTRDLCEVSL